MAEHVRWVPLKPKLCQTCAMAGTWSMVRVTDGSSAGVEHYCDTHKPIRQAEVREELMNRPRKKKAGKNHSEYGEVGGGDGGSGGLASAMHPKAWVNRFR